MSTNRFTNRTNTTETVEYDLQEMLLRNMQREFPNDPIYSTGNLTAYENTQTITALSNTVITPETEIRNSLNILTINSGSDKFVEYKIDKTYPTISEDDLDDLLDDEWEYFVRQDTLRPVTETGLFLINAEIELSPTDFHYAYISRGPNTIQSRIAAGNDINDVVRSTFCVFYIENGVALPIPNYQTLEVLLVERGLTYDDIREATAEEITLYDMTLDGSFIGDRTATRPEDPLEEFTFRQVLDRSRNWNYRVRYDSGYRPKAPFERDPGDYLKPIGYRGATGTTDLYLNEDPNDLLFDLPFQKQTYLEKLRAKYEGKMVIALWPTRTDLFDQVYVDGSTTEIISDGLTYLVRMMINGFWKQVIDEQVFRTYATINNYDISALAPRPNSPYTNFIESSPDRDDFISGPNGLINLLVRAGGIEVLQGFSTVWSDFPHIVEADRLDIAEYKQYLDNYNNGGDPFNIEYLIPYEPAGSTAYYPAGRTLLLQRQVTQQTELDALRANILELWPILAARVASLELIANSLPSNYRTLFNERFGANSPLYKIITAVDGYKYVKRKRSGLKEKDQRSNLLELFERNERISVGAFNNPNDADRIVGVSNWGRVWDKTPSQNGITGLDIIVSTLFPQYATLQFLENITDLGNIGTNKLPRNTIGVRKRSLMKDTNYIKNMVAYEVSAVLQNIDLLNRANAADELVTELRSAIAEAKDFVIEIDDLLVQADSITEFEDIYSRITVLNTALASFNDDGLAFCDQVRIDIESIFKSHLDKLYRGVQYFRQRVHDEVGNRSKFGVQWSPSARSIIEQYLPGKTFDNYLPRQE